MRTGTWLLMAGMCLGWGRVAAADTVYTYTGNAFGEDEYGVFTSSDSVSGSFTVATPLTPNATYAEVPYLAYSFSDGYQTLSPAGPFVPVDAEISVITDALGGIASWSIYVDGGGQDQISTTLYAPGYGEDVATFDPYPADKNASPSSYAQSNAYGTWSGPETTATPEPAGWVLLGTGMVGVVGLGLRRSG